MRGTLRKWAVAAAVLLAIGAVIAGLAVRSAPRGREPQELRIAVRSLMPSESDLIRIGVGEKLVETGYTFMDPLPRLAEKWERLGGGRWRFYLRPGVKFHNGAPLDAETVSEALTEYLKKAPLQNVNPRITWRVEGPLVLSMKTELTGIPLHQYFGRFIVFHKDSWGPDGQFVKPIGTGPFKVEKVNFGNEMVLSANEEYWGGVPRLRRITLREVKDPQTRAMMLESGEADWIQMVLRQDVPRLKELGFQVIHSRYLYNAYVHFHCGKPPFDDPRLRKAVSFCLDRKAIAGAAFEGLVDPTCFFFREDLPFNPGGLTRFDCDPGRAREQLEAAEYAPDASGRWAKGGKPLRFRLLTRSDRPEHQLAGQVIQRQLDRAGIECDIEVMESGAWDECTKRGEYEATVDGRMPSFCPDPAGYFATDWKSGVPNNFAFYANAALDALIDEALMEEEPGKRNDILRRMIATWWEDAPVAVICSDWSRETFAVSPRVLHADAESCLINSFPGVETSLK